MSDELKTVNFTPQYLKELRIKHRNTLDAGLVDWAKKGRR